MSVRLNKATKECNVGLKTAVEFLQKKGYEAIEENPNAISGRTSYLRVRLEFLRYPQVIRHHCNGGRFGPP